MTVGKMKRHDPRVVVTTLMGILIIISGCSARHITRSYYTLTLPSDVQPAETRYRAELWVREAEITPVYNRPQVVYRKSPYQLEYFHHAQWADRPQRMVTQALVHCFRNSGLFTSVYDRLGATVPSHMLESTILALEQLDGDNIWYAHFQMSIRLIRYSDKAVIWQTSFDERQALDSPEVSLTVRALSDILAAKLSDFAPDVERALAERPKTPPTGDANRLNPTGEVASASSLDKRGIPGDRPETVVSEPGWVATWRRSVQYNSDPTTIPAGRGAIFVPSISEKAEDEPPVDVFRGSTLVDSHYMGRRIPVTPGKYVVRFGSGTLEQRQEAEVEVRENEVRIVEPTWSALEVSVVNDRFIAFRGAYELIRMKTRESVGVGYGADEELGERTQVWVLEPGLYKIVQPGSTYRSRTNFATVELAAGAFTLFTLVMDSETQDFLGSGVTERDSEDTNATHHWRSKSTFGGDIVWSHQTDASSNATTASLFADTLIRYEKDKHSLSNRIEVEESYRFETSSTASTSGPQFSGELRSDLDRFYANSIYLYDLLSWVGPYLRIGIDTELIPTYNYFDGTSIPSRDVEIRDNNGSVIDTLYEQDRVRISGPFSPLRFFEGIGGNFGVFHNTLLDLDLRVGLGGRQEPARDTLIPQESSTDSVYIVQHASDAFLAGPELAVIASSRLSRHILISTEFDSLFPFGNQASATFTWRNLASLRLSSYASLLYAINLDRNPNVGREVPLLIDQSLKLRFSYTLF